MYVSGKLTTYPSPNLTFTLTSHFGQNVGLSQKHTLIHNSIRSPHLPWFTRLRRISIWRLVVFTNLVNYYYFKYFVNILHNSNNYSVVKKNDVIVFSMSIFASKWHDYKDYCPARIATIYKFLPGEGRVRYPRHPRSASHYEVWNYSRFYVRMNKLVPVFAKKIIL